MRTTTSALIGASRVFDGVIAHVTTFLERVIELNARYRAGGLQAYVPEGLRDSERTLEELIEQNGDRMGDTRELTAEQKTDLVAHLRSL